MFGKIGDAIGGALGKVSDVLGGVGDALGGLTGIAKSLMDSPLGALLSMVIPGPGAALQAAAQIGEMLGGLSSSVGGGENY